MVKAVTEADCALLTTAQMARADALAVAAGVPSLTLMENAGRAVAEAAHRFVAKPGARIAVFCGPGNNGGDGFVAARHLKRMGHDVRVFLLGGREDLKGDAAVMASRWDGAVRAPHVADPDSMDLLIDALFGAGLVRPLAGEAADLVAELNASRTPVVAVDVPSGLDGTTGAARGAVIEASATVTFFRMKPGHLLMPGRRLCGQTHVADIGIPASVLAEIQPKAFANGPALWQARMPSIGEEAHKYSRGHAVIVSGPADGTGAARLGARGALRIGAGLVTLAGTPAASAINATHVTAVMVKSLAGERALADFLSDDRRNAVLIGPGAGVGPETMENVLAVLASSAAAVLDADALTSFSAGGEGARPLAGLGFTAQQRPRSAAPADLFAAIKRHRAPVVLTPHEGEFKRLFPEIGGEADKLERARMAAAQSGAVVVLKGPDTVIAEPGGRAAINHNAPPTLATAGSGDVLAGFVTGLLAQHMAPFEAACAAVWLHGDCARRFGPGLIAEDIPEILPRVLADLFPDAGAAGSPAIPV